MLPCARSTNSPLVKHMIITGRNSRESGAGHKCMKPCPRQALNCASNATSIRRRATNEKAIKDVQGRSIAQGRESCGQANLVWNTDLIETMEASQDLHSGEARHKFREVHAHEDFPERNDVQWMKHTHNWLPEYQGD